MSTGELLEIDPLELRFPFELKKQISCPLRLSNQTDEYIAFKVKTTSPKKYCVRPNTGVVLPRSTCDVVVTMQAQKEAPLDLQCKDKFLVQSVITANGATLKDITPEMFTKESGNAVEEFKLRVVYVSPPRPPSPVAEDSEEGTSTNPSASDNGFLVSAEHVSALNVEKEKAEPRDSNPETSALITKLQEEKNFALLQNKMLRQELDLLKRDIERQSSFSIAFVVMVALIGVLIGYLFKT